MSIDFMTGNLGFSFSNYSKLNTNIAAPVDNKQDKSEEEDALKQSEQLQLSPIRVDTKIHIDPLMKHQSLDTIEMQRAISDMQKDAVLTPYQRFVQKEEESDEVFSLSVAPIDQNAVQVPHTGVIVQGADGTVILKK